VKGFADGILPGADFPSIDAAQAEGFQMSNRRTGTRLRKPAIPAQVRNHRDRISARWMRSKSLERCAAANRGRLAVASPLWRKQVDLPRILAALQGSPKRLRAVQRSSDGSAHRRTARDRS
jgi:hypothetical protein